MELLVLCLKATMIQLVLIICTTLHEAIKQLDVKNIFLHETHENRIYCETTGFQISQSLASCVFAEIDTIQL